MYEYKSKEMTFLYILDQNNSNYYEEIKISFDEK
jgi:hypothetical protein